MSLSLPENSIEARACQDYEDFRFTINRGRTALAARAQRLRFSPGDTTLLPPWSQLSEVARESWRREAQRRAA